MINSLPLFSLIQAIKQGGFQSKSNRVYIEKIMPSSPASLVGLLVGDILISINGKEINTSDDAAEITKKSKGQPLDLIINRSGKSLNIQITPRIDYPSTEGPMGVVLSNFEFKKEPILILIPKLLMEKTTWGDPFQTPILSLLNIDFFRIKYFILGFSQLIISIGLVKLKRWALYGTYLIEFIGLIFIIGILLKPHNIVSEQFFVFDIVLSLTFLMYLYKQRSYFE